MAASASDASDAIQINAVRRPSSASDASGSDSSIVYDPSNVQARRRRFHRRAAARRRAMQLQRDPMPPLEPMTPPRPEPPVGPYDIWVPETPPRPDNSAPETPPRNDSGDETDLIPLLPVPPHNNRRARSRSRSPPRRRAGSRSRSRSPPAARRRLLHSDTDEEIIMRRNSLTIDGLPAYYLYNDNRVYHYENDVLTQRRHSPFMHPARVYSRFVFDLGVNDRDMAEALTMLIDSHVNRRVR